MTTTVTSNKKNISAQIHFNATDTITVAGAVGVSDIAIDDEVIEGATISQVFVGMTAGGSVTITRNSETIAVYDTAGWHDYAGTGMALNVESDQDITVTLSGTAYAFLELKKIITSSTSEYLVG